MTNYLHILIDQPEKYTELVNDNLSGIYPVLSWSKAHFITILENLSPDQEVCIWFHIRRYGTDNTVQPIHKLAGLKWAKQFKSDSLLKNINYYFTTSGAIDDDVLRACENRLFGYDEMDKAVEVGMLNEKIGDKDIVKLQRVSEIFKVDEPVVSNFDSIKVSFPELNNWRTNYLRFFIEISVLKKILGTCFKETFNLNHGFKVKVIEPGLSGAYILKVEYYDNFDDTWPKKRILKVQKKHTLIPKEIEAASLYRQRIEVTTDTFIQFDFDQSKVVDNFDCCVYALANDATTLGVYLRKNLSRSDLNELKRIIQHVFVKYERNNDGDPLHWQVRIIKSKPWTGGVAIDAINPDYYEGLELSGEYKQFTKSSIVELTSQYSDTYLKEIFKANNIETLHNGIFEFIDNGKWGLKVIDGDDDVPVPISYVHGDFNCGNILVNDTDGLNPKFIDLSQITKNKHAFFDIGKLSVEIEKRVVSDAAINDGEIHLRNWIAFHQAWLVDNHKKELSGVLSDSDGLIKIYAIIDEVKSHAIKRCGIFGINDFTIKQAVRQFYLVRIHYFFRMINQKHLVPAKRMFALKAIVDTLDHLSKK